ncbi:cysteine dioxygenase type I [Melanomma pulvis-pyrius CBS 109.77]|uniref:Cysteine dioxygenase n=1 Tax=Melanomma pulvis-pyrius CBS 109.77 TaxID=1314802 RepID=A0A6A6X447_9PLEO|nr:cysteine dioxygenase type I [Melanomma pulvis-pyrius CBS 109.77]
MSEPQQDPYATTQTNKFDALVRSLSEMLGPTSGINSEDVNPDELQALMAAYNSDEPEWKKYDWQDASKCYTRNLVDKGNGKSNLLILVWTPGQTSSIHDHANAHCIMKILRGCLVETRYARPTVELNSERECPLKCIKETTYGTNEVTYMSDQLGLHKISNPDPTDFAVSLHLYTPPNASVYGCNTYNEETSKVMHYPGCELYSRYGHRL